MPDPTPTRRVTSRLRRLATTALVAVLALTAAPVASAKAASGSYRDAGQCSALQGGGEGLRGRAA